MENIVRRSPVYSNNKCKNCLIIVGILCLFFSLMGLGLGFAFDGVTGATGGNFSLNNILLFCGCVCVMFALPIGLVTLLMERE